MARKRSTGGERGSRVEIEDLVAGRTVPDARRLLQLIHEVNPTGRTVGDREEAERYASKSGLQSLLVKHFRDDLLVEPDKRAGVVGLRHRYLPVDGCHAVLAELGDEERSWVQLQLDTGAAAGSLGAGGRGGDRDQAKRRQEGRRGGERVLEPADLVAEARRQIEAYAYEEARETLELAVRDGLPEAALVLVQLLVDSLGADEDALALEEGLEPEDAEHLEMRILLALAAARSQQQPERAFRFLRDVSPMPGTARVAEVLATLARAAIVRGDPDAAQKLLAQAREFDPAHPDLVALASEASAVRKRARAPLEDELLAAFAAGQAAGQVEPAERMARELLMSFPDSPVAGRMLRQIGEQRQREEGRALLARASTALAGGDHDAAVRYAREARALGVLTADLEASIESAVVLRRQAAADAVCQQLGAALGPALAAYARLNEETRALVRAQTNVAAVAWLDQALAGAGSRAPEVATAAGVALVVAIEDLQHGRADEFLHGLLPHERALADVPRARQLFVELERRLVLERNREAITAQQAAKAALERNELVEAKTLLDGLDVRGCCVGGRWQLVARCLWVGRPPATLGRKEGVGVLLSEGNFLAARIEVDFLLTSEKVLKAEQAEQAEEDRWRAQRERIDAEVQRSFRVHVCEVGSNDVEPLMGALALDDGLLVEEPSIWLSAGELFFCSGVGSWVFIGVYDLALGRFKELVQLCCPGRMERATVHVQGDRVLLAAEGGLLELARQGFRVVAWHSMSSVVPAADIFEDLAFAPGAEHLWIESRQGGSKTRDDWTTSVVGVARFAVQRELKSVRHPVAIHGLDPLAVASLPFDGGGRLHTTRGIPADSFSFQHPAQVHAVAVHPASTADLLAIVGPVRDPFGPEQDDDDEEGIEAVELLRATAWKSAGRGVGIEGVFMDGSFALATSLETGCSFLLVSSDEGTKQLIGIAPCAPGGTGDLAILFRTTVPDNTLLVQDSSARTVLVVATTKLGRLQVAVLGTEPPALLPGAPLQRGMPSLQPSFFCEWHAPKEYELRTEVHGALQRLPTAMRLEWALKKLDPRHAPQTAVAIIRELETLGEMEAALQVAHIAAEGAPDDGVIALCRAGVLARLGRWNAVRLLLEPVVVDLMPPPAVRHLFHLLGVAKLLEGGAHAADDAREAWQRGLAHEGECKLADCIEVVSPLPDPSVPEQWGPDQPVLRQLLGAINAADVCLAGGEAEGAIRASGRAAVLVGGELQSLARLAEAHLRCEAHAGAEHFAKVLALVTFVGVAENKHHERRCDLPIPGAQWGDERIAGLVRRASAWLKAATLVT
jgi:tetratricopeptide (TPR) repeat protein